jgi:hypothetical protein
MLRSSYSENLQKEKKDQSDHGDSEEKGVGLHVSNLERAKEGPGGKCSKRREASHDGIDDETIRYIKKGGN